MTEATLPSRTPEQSATPPRPRHSEHDVISAVATSMLPEIIEWLGDDYQEDMKADIEEHLIEAMKDNPGLDGYDIAKHLDNRFMWECNAELVSILDSALSHASTAHSERIKEWVKANNIRPKLGVGQKISSSMFRGEGTITAIMEDRACYVVQNEEFRSTHQNQPPTSGLLVPYEQAKQI